jgi:ABC-type transport system substrate-binding protein
MRPALITTALSALALNAAMPPDLLAADAPARGGSIVVTYQDDIATLDPAIGYDWQNPSMMQLIADGLMGYKAGTTELVPDLAESFAISEDGLTYTFKLRDGVKFHNGRELTAADVKYTLERLVDPATQSPGQGYYAVIEGFDAMVAGEADALSGVTTPDERTVVIELSRPNAVFLNVLAMHFSSIVPKEEVEKWGADWGTHPVGTGAYRIAEWTLGQRIVFERNPDYRHGTGPEDVPYLDQIIWEVGQDPSVAFLRLTRGEVDILGDGIPPAHFVDVVDNPEYQQNGMIIEHPMIQTSYVTMNVNIEPFDDVRVRQAVNMAINKDRIVRIINNRAIPANQPLPPNMPGHDPDYAGYPYDPAKAKALLAEAGHPDGFSTELWNMNTDPNPRIAQAIQQDLAEVGIDAELHSVASSVVIAAGGEADQAPMIWSGGMAWISDFPDPSGFYWSILGCGGAVPGGWNWAWYCNEEIEAKAAEADAMVDLARADERIDLWREVYTEIMADAPWVPVFNTRYFTLRSERMGGDPVFYVSPTYIPMHYEYLYVKDAE